LTYAITIYKRLYVLAVAYILPCAYSIEFHLLYNICGVLLKVIFFKKN